MSQRKRIVRGDNRITPSASYDSVDYEADKRCLTNAGLSPDEYEQAVKEMAKRNGF